MSVIRMTEPPRWGGGVRRITPSGTGSSVPLFDAGADVVIQRPVRTRSPGATSAVGSLVSERMQERPDAFTPVTIRRTFPGMSIPLLTWSRRRGLLQRQLDQAIGPGVLVEVAAGRDHVLELGGRNRKSGNDVADASCFLVEGPDELASGGLLGIAPAVPGVDGDARTEEGHLVRWDEGHALHQVQDLGRVVGLARIEPRAS